ncbi:hypothetical protein [Calothrix sp. UHCC 0171]|uniref:hypothetical protein n=1 Tax=Calothrix sp. UHCC 0171 TaxID=3110245 RepID=UPI002B213786|nr:hypothetical protein [Calothrix sp. UHCC 0171]MEA5571195.1 hypothetical protein [Calothrix sp. UHCC 0171]
MKNRRYASPYFRYLKARLWNLTRPGFWGTAIFLSVVGLVIREFWARPDMLTRQNSNSTGQQSESSSTLSDEERAVAADIDNLPVLAYDFERGLESIPSPEVIATPKKANKNPLEEAFSKQNTVKETKLNSSATNSNSLPKFNNPFLSEANSLLQFTNTQSNSRFASLNPLNKSSSREDETEYAANQRLGYTRRNSLLPSNNERNSESNIGLYSLQPVINQSFNSQNSVVLNNSNQNLNSLPISGNQSFNAYSSYNSSQSNLTNSSYNNGNYNYGNNYLNNSVNTFGQQITNTLPSSLQNVPNALPNPVYTQPSALTNNFSNNSISTGIGQPIVTTQPLQTYTDYTNYNSNNFNNNTAPLTNTNQSIQVIPPVATPTQSYTTPYSNLPSNSNINNDAVKRGLQKFDPSLFPNQVPNQ